MRPIAAMLFGSLCVTAPAHSEDPQVLLQKYKCNACHSTRETKTGPAFVDVAARYRGYDRAVSTLAGVIKDGAHGAGPWYMPPHPEISAADARRLARYILALK